MHLPTGIDGLKERQEERENEKIGLHIYNSFMTVAANYTLAEVATLVCLDPEEEESCVHLKDFFPLPL